MNPRVTVATIMYGNRWKFLSQVVLAAMKDKHVVTMVIVDNGSLNQKEIEEGVKPYGDRIIVIREEKNRGSAGGFALAIDRARQTDCDYILILDDDSVPEDNFVTLYLNALSYFPDKQVVLSGNRCDVLDNKEYFYKPSILDDSPRGTFFEVFSVKKLGYFFRLLFMHKKGKEKRGPFIPIIPTEGFIYGGTFLPIEVVRKAPLPDKSLFLYGDDIEYSWNVKKLGYESYLCERPRLHDIDSTFGASGSHIFGQFEAKALPFQIYFRMRNMVLLSRRHTHQSRPILFLNMMIWTLGLFLLGLFKSGPTRLYFSRVILITKAVIAGYYPHSQFAKNIEKTFPQVQ